MSFQSYQNGKLIMKHGRLDLQMRLAEVKEYVCQKTHSDSPAENHHESPGLAHIRPA